MTSIPIEGTRTAAKRRDTSRRPAALHDGHEPWARRDALLPGLFIGVGLVLLVVGWFGISDAIALESQTRWLALGIVGLIVGGLGMVVWLLAAMIRIGQLRRAVYAEIDRRVSAAERAAAAVPTPTAELVVGFATAPGMRRYHRVTCLMLQGKKATPAAEADLTKAGLVPCGVCLPAATPAATATDGGGRHA
jgi:hypothetical protein